MLCTEIIYPTLLMSGQYSDSVKRSHTNCSRNFAVLAKYQQLCYNCSLKLKTATGHLDTEKEHSLICSFVQRQE